MNKMCSIMVLFPERCKIFFCFFRTMQNYKRHFSVFACLVFIFIAGCSTGRVPLADSPLGCSNYKWIHTVPESTDTHHFFVGVSEENHIAEADARNQASIDCISQFARHCGVEIKLYYNYLAVSYGQSSEMTDPTVAMKDSRQHIVEAFVSRLKPKEYCAQRIENFSDTSKLESFWKAYVLATVPIDEVQKVKDYKPPEPPPPLSLHLTNMGNNRYCIEVRSYLGMPVENFRLLKNGHPIFPNAYCPATNYNYRVNNDTATLDFSSTGSILLGGTNDSFNFCLPESGSITVNCSIDNKHYSFSHKYD